MTFFDLDCGIHESSVAHTGPCPHCAAFAAKLRAEWAAEDAPPVERVRVMERDEVSHETLMRERAEFLASLPKPVLKQVRSRPRRISPFVKQASDEQRAAIVRRALAGEPVKALAREIGFSRAAVYVWITDARGKAA